MDHDVGDTPGTPSGVEPPVGALSTTDPEGTPTLRQRLAPMGAQLSGAGGALSVAATDRLDVAAVASALAGRPERVEWPGLRVDAVTALGDVGAPQLSMINGDCEVAGELSGAGILLVRGLLRVSGAMRFTGLLIAMGGIVFESSSHVDVLGALWRAPSADPRMTFHGTGGVAYSKASLVHADAAFPGTLPHELRLVGWQERL